MNTKRKLAVACALVVAATVALVAWKGWANSQAAAQREAQRQEAGTAQGAEAPGAPAPAAVELTDEQQRLVRAYDDDMEYVARILEGNLWESKNGATAEFARGSVTERAGGEERPQPFAIAAVEHSVEDDGAGGSVDAWRGSALTGSGEAIFTLSQAHSKDAGDMPWSLSCRALSLDERYRLAKRSDGLEVSDLSSAYAVIGGEKGGRNVSKKLEEHAARAVPTATKATWDGKAEVDFAGGTAELAFKLDDARKTVVKVVVSADGGNVVFHD